MPEHSPASDRGLSTRWLFAAIGMLTLWRLTVAWLMPVTQDEAYYFDWARSLAWGYFDHPPGVAFFGIGTWLIPSSALAARLGTVAASALTLVILVRFYRDCGLRSRADLGLALVLAAATIPGLASGILTTPDAPLALCWALALHEALAALRRDRRRWLGAGLATGLGLLGKYTMVLIGPVFLWAILWADPKALRSPWPYLGGLLAVLVFAPNLLWNADNDWLTMRFQLGHGLSTETGELLENPLPPPVTDSPSLPEPEPPMTVAERVGSIAGYFGTQLGLWGLIAIPLLVAPFRRNERRDAAQGTPPIRDSGTRALLVAGSLFPLLFFGLVSSFSEVEPNWPVMYLFCAAPLAALWLRGMRRWVLTTAAMNLILISLYAVHGATAALPLPDSQNRILRETHGFKALAEEAAQLEGPIFADRYQTTAMLRFYAPGLHATQWPGIMRPSEYLRGKVAPHITLDEIRAAGGFWLVARTGIAPQLDGFVNTAPATWFDCKGMDLVQSESPPCDKPLHRWIFYRYTSRGER